MKQVNLSLAAAGDVAVLRNGEHHTIEKIEPLTDRHYTHNITFPKNSHVCISDCTAYTNKGLFWIDTLTQRDITDILRNGASIFNNQNQ